MSAIIHKNYDELFNLDQMFAAWRIFRRGKTRKKDVMDFDTHLEDNMFSLWEEVNGDKYHHSLYKYFQIFDNKKRDIFKATIKDRIIHQIIYDYLSSVFNIEFISDSYASRKGKGQHLAIKTFYYFVRLAGAGRKRLYILKGDVRKYFDNIDHNILFGLIKEKVFDEKILKIIQEIISSYHSAAGFFKGIPLGNITSQIFANIYLNSLDQYVKKELRCRFYVRYNDDVAMIFQGQQQAEFIREKIMFFVKEKLSLTMPLEKTSIRKIDWGVDFLGCTLLPQATLLRNKTKAKIYANISRKNVFSYLALLKHHDSFNLKQKVLALEKISDIC